MKQKFISDLSSQEIESIKDSQIFAHLWPILKKWKSSLYRHLSSEHSVQNLEDYSPFLTTINSYSGIELPGKLQDLDREPFPEERIFISKFESKLLKDFDFNRMIHIQCSNGHSYRVTNMNSKKDSTKVGIDD